jgi:hypothetical protein
MSQSKKVHGNKGKPKSRLHRERLRVSVREYWFRVHEALAAQGSSK